MKGEGETLAPEGNMVDDIHGLLHRIGRPRALRELKPLPMDSNRAPLGLRPGHVARLPEVFELEKTHLGAWAAIGVSALGRGFNSLANGRRLAAVIGNVKLEVAVPIYRHGDERVELMPLAEDAVATLGYILPEKADWLAEIVATDDGHGARGVRERGAVFSKEERLAVGLPAYGDKMSRDVWEALTPAGRSDPVRNFDLSFNRVWWHAIHIAEAQTIKRLMKNSGLFVGARLQAWSGEPEHGGQCEAAKRCDGQLFTEIPNLPFDGCDQPICKCHLWRLTKLDLAKGR